MFPDIEIYIKNTDLTRVEEWLNLHFESVSVKKISQGFLLEVTYQKHSSKVHYVENATRGQFSCLWFKNNQTPWPTDLACATSAADFLQTEIRCSDGSWQEPDPEQGQNWYRLKGDATTKIRWAD
jgi:hypothetical protein